MCQDAHSVYQEFLGVGVSKEKSWIEVRIVGVEMKEWEKDGRMMG